MTEFFQYLLANPEAKYLFAMIGFIAILGLFLVAQMEIAYRKAHVKIDPKDAQRIYNCSISAMVDRAALAPPKRPMATKRNHDEVHD